MRIGLVAHTNAPWTPHYDRGLRALGHRVRVFSFSPEALPGADVIHLKGSRPPGFPRPLWFLSQVPRLARQLDAFGPDVVLATYLTSNGMTAALAWRGPLVVSARGGDVLPQAGYLPGGALHGSMMRFVCGRATLVHAVSEELREALQARGVASSRIATFPVGVDLEAFTVPERAPRRGRPPRIVCARRHEPVYANHVLIEALAALRARGAAFTCAVLGGGPLLEERRRHAVASGLSDVVDFTGQIPIEEVRRHLLDGDVYVSASLSDGTSSSLLEAMACGLFPVVSRIRANLPWIQDGRTGLLFDPGDATGLAAALERALLDESMRRDAAGTNRSLVEAEGDRRRNTARLAGMLELAAAGDAAVAAVTSRRPAAPSSSAPRSRGAGGRSGSGRGAAD